ncbi:hypothetical protein D3C86_2076100 [compost metagenome]
MGLLVVPEVYSSSEKSSASACKMMPEGVCEHSSSKLRSVLAARRPAVIRGSLVAALQPATAVTVASS